MKKSFLFSLIFIFLTSCSDDDVIPIDNSAELVTKIKLDIVDLNSQNDNYYVYFEYDDNLRLTKKTGGWLTLSASTGYNTFFSNEIFTTLIYSEKEVVVKTFSSSTNFDVPENVRYYTLNSQQQILQKYIPHGTTNSWNKQQQYIYDSNKLINIKTIFPDMSYNPDDSNDYILTYSEQFTYDENQNLVKSEITEEHNGIAIGNKIVRTFEEYDNSINPFKRLNLLDEYFYRSISKNNYRKYTEIHYSNNNVTSVFEKTWNFEYDSQGNIILE
ncbi:hypothetical protein [Salinimicrobium gaetbulicola]|uniref:YD repeat-containing protein n=1 Tax=Salinimicrobium gaetbulicola TaxID=999702 RepID=A0ABW3IBA4_9FLAO